MSWSSAIEAISKLIETGLKKLAPSAAEKAKQMRLDAEARFKEYIRQDAERESSPED